MKPSNLRVHKFDSSKKTKSFNIQNERKKIEQVVVKWGKACWAARVLLFSRNAMVKEVEPEKVHLKTQDMMDMEIPQSHTVTNSHYIHPDPSRIILTNGHDGT